MCMITYIVLVYTTQVNSAFLAIWLVPQSWDIKYYSPPGGFRVKKMSRETHFIRKWSNFLGIAIKLVLYILKQLFASVSVNSGEYLPRRSGSVNIHRYSPPLRRIIVIIIVIIIVVLYCLTWWFSSPLHLYDLVLQVACRFLHPAPLCMLILHAILATMVGSIFWKSLRSLRSFLYSSSHTNWGKMYSL